MISLTSVVYLVVYLMVAALVFWLLNYLVDTVVTQEPFHKVAKVVLIVFAVLVAIGLLLSLVGGGPVFVR